MADRYSEVKKRLTDWAMCLEMPPHEPGRPDTSLEYRMMVLGQIVSGGRLSDGGLMAAYMRHKHAIREAEKADEVHQAVKRLRSRDPDAYRVITLAFLDRPGYLMPSRVGAMELNIDQRTWRHRFHTALSFIDGAIVCSCL